MPLYDSLVGRTTKQNTEVATFANAIRKLSTSYKRVQNMQEAARLKLQWAEESHNIAMANAAQKFEQERLKRERAEYEFEQLQQATQEQRELFQRQREARGGAIKAFLQHRKGEEGAGLDEALVSLATEDPDFSSALNDVLEGVITAVDAPDIKERETAMARLKEAKAKLELGSEEALRRQREAGAVRSEVGTQIDVEKFKLERAALEQEQTEARRARIESARQETISGVYREMDEFGGRDATRKRYKEEYNVTVNNAQAELNGLMREIGARQNVATGEDLEALLQTSLAGGASFSQALRSQTDTGMDEQLQGLIENVDDIVSKMTNAKQTYLQQVNYLDDLDNFTSDMFDALVNEKGYTLTEARAELPAAVPELFVHLKTMMDNVKTAREGETAKQADYTAAYEKYINNPVAPLKRVHRDLLKKAWQKVTLRAEDSIKQASMQLFGTETPE